MANSYYKIALAGIIGLIIFGVIMAFQQYDSTIYPIDQARGLLLRIQATSEPQTVHNDLKTIKELLPQHGNPVWIFPTDSTDFGLMQTDLDGLISTVDKISDVATDSAAFHTGITNVHLEANTLYSNLLDATPYMYVSVSNILFGCIWVAVIIGIFALLKKKRERLQSYDAEN